jgi:hypothetical protein
MASTGDERSRWQLLVAPTRLNEAESRRRHRFFQLLYFSYAALTIGLMRVFSNLWLPILLGSMCLLYALVFVLNRTVRRNVRGR